MTKWKLSRRSFLEGTAAVAVGGATLGRARGAYRGRQALGRLLGPLGPGRQRLPDQAGEGVGGEGEGRPPDRLHPVPGQQGPADHPGRVAGALRPRPPDLPDLGGQQPRRGLEPVDDVMKEVLASNGKTNPVVEYLAHHERPLDRRPGHARLADQGPVLAPRPDEAARGHRRGRDVPGRRPDQPGVGQELDVRHVPRRRREVRQGRRSLRHRPRHHLRLGRLRRRDLPRLRRAARGREGRDHGQVRGDPPGARLHEASRGLPAAGRDRVGRRVEQPLADLGQGGADLQPAERLGRRQARRAQGRGAVLDPPDAGRAQGPVRALPAVQLGHLGLLEEQVGGQEPAGPPVDQGRHPRSSSRAARATTSRATRRCTTSRPGPSRGRPRARCGTTPSSRASRPTRSRRRRPRRRSPSRSTARRP